GPGTLHNSGYSMNRFIAQAGAAFNLGGAGVFVEGRYLNSGGATHYTASCDASCSNRGHQGINDPGCSRRSVLLTAKCLPDAAFAYLGTIRGGGGGVLAHGSYMSNIIFIPIAQAPVKQCSGASTNLGLVCETAANTCAGGATCSGTPAKCQTGTEAGKYCCTGATPTCSARSKTAMIVMPDFGTSTTQSDTNISLNPFLVPVNGDSIVGIDMLRGASLGNLSIVGLQITNNIFNGETTTNSTAILFPTSGSFSGVNIIGNLFHGPWIKLKNFFGSYGGALFTPLMGRLTADWQNDDIVFENIAGGVLTFNVIPSATYQFTCTLLYTAAA